MSTGQHRERGAPIMSSIARTASMHALNIHEFLTAPRDCRARSTARRDTETAVAIVVAALLLLVALAVVMSQRVNQGFPPPQPQPRVTVTATLYPPGTHAPSQQLDLPAGKVRPVTMIRCGDTPGFCPNPPWSAAPADGWPVGVSGDW